jgi:hypothetical protein
MGGIDVARCALSAAAVEVAAVVDEGVSEDELIAPCAMSTSAAAANAAPRPMNSPLFDFFSDVGSSRLSSALRGGRRTGATR